MNTGLLFRASLLGGLALLVLLAWEQVKTGDEMAKLLFFLTLGAVGGLWAVKYFIPWLGDAVGSFIYSSSEPAPLDESMRATAKLAQGDYEGAIAAFEEQLRRQPGDPHPVSEIAKIHSDRLHDPEAAVAVLQQQLKLGHWVADDAAFLLFRLAEVHAEKRRDFAAARQVLEHVEAQFPNTRHSANAHHRRHELDQAEFAGVLERRRKGGGAG
jgi:tetratricopeptide (TPR) repeat protein